MLEKILSRLLEPNGRDALFGFDEIQEWPKVVFENLVKTGLLIQSNPTQFLECYGCEENCFMLVQVFGAEEDRPARAFISCDKSQNLGRVKVKPERLRQWKTSKQLLVVGVSKAIGLSEQPQNIDTENLWELGLLKGLKHKSILKLLFASDIYLEIAGHKIKLVELLTLDDSGLKIDKEEIIRLIDSPISKPGNPNYKPTTIRREARKLETEAKYISWRKKAAALRKSPKGKNSERWISLQISKSPFAKGAKPDTIRKHIRK